VHPERVEVVQEVVDDTVTHSRAILDCSRASSIELHSVSRAVSGRMGMCSRERKGHAIVLH
jgi:hypothetical protein